MGVQIHRPPNYQTLAAFSWLRTFRNEFGSFRTRDEIARKVSERRARLLVASAQRNQAKTQKRSAAHIVCIVLIRRESMPPQTGDKAFLPSCRWSCEHRFRCDTSVCVLSVSMLRLLPAGREWSRPTNSRHRKYPQADEPSQPGPAFPLQALRTFCSIALRS